MVVGPTPVTLNDLHSDVSRLLFKFKSDGSDEIVYILEQLMRACSENGGDTPVTISGGGTTAWGLCPDTLTALNNGWLTALATVIRRLSEDPAPTVTGVVKVAFLIGVWRRNGKVTKGKGNDATAVRLMGWQYANLPLADGLTPVDDGLAAAVLDVVRRVTQISDGRIKTDITDITDIPDIRLCDRAAAKNELTDKLKLLLFSFPGDEDAAKGNNGDSQEKVPRHRDRYPKLHSRMRKFIAGTSL